MSHPAVTTLIAAVYPQPDKAHPAVEQLIARDFPMDRISLLYRAGGQGDDFLGIAYGDDKERIKVWSEQGALWGSLAGLLAGVSGLFFVPGVGMLLLAGPVINAITGAALGAGLMAGSALATRLTIALHRLGIPEDRLQHLHQAIMDGKTVLLIHADSPQVDELERRLLWQGAQEVMLLSGDN